MTREKSSFTFILPTHYRILLTSCTAMSFQNQINHLTLAELLGEDPDEDDVALYTNPRLIDAHHSFVACAKKTCREHGIMGTYPKITPTFIQQQIQHVCRNPQSYFRPGLHLHRLRMQLRIHQQLATRKAA